MWLTIVYLSLAPSNKSGSPWKKEASFTSQFKQSHKYFSSRQSSHFGKQKYLTCTSDFITPIIKKTWTNGQDQILTSFTASSGTFFSDTSMFSCAWGETHWGHTVAIRAKVPTVYPSIAFSPSGPMSTQRKRQMCQCYYKQSNSQTPREWPLGVWRAHWVLLKQHT